MRRQVMLSVAAVVAFAVSSALAAPIDFSTDPNLATDWTQYMFYNSSANPSGSVGSAWNEADQNLTLSATNIEALAGLLENGNTRSDTDALTMTLSNYTANTPAVKQNWTCAGMVISASASPNLTDGSSWYSIYFQQDFDNGLRFSVNRGLTEIGRTTLTSLPGTMKLDVLRDGSDYVFKANGAEICRDATYASTSLSHYFMYWGGGATDTLSVSVDNYGVVPEPSALVLLAGGLFGLAAYAWRKRK